MQEMGRLSSGRMGRRTFELLGLASKTWFGLVVGVAFGIVGLVQAIRGASGAAYLLAIFALVALAVVLFWVAYNALRERDAASQDRGPVHQYNAPVTINAGPTPDAFGPAASRPSSPSNSPDTRPIIKLSDHVQFPPNEPPVIRNRTFQNAVLRGPLLAYCIGCTFENVTFGVFGDDYESILWPVDPDKTKLGIVALEYCKFTDCATQQIAFVGTKEDLEPLKSQLASMAAQGRFV